MKQRLLNLSMLIVLGICLMISFASLGLANTSKKLWATDAATMSKLQESVETRWQKCLDEKGKLRPRQGAREVSRLLFDGLISNVSSEKIDLLLRQMVELQDRNPSSPTCGNLRWYVENEKPADLNAVEFTVQRVAILWLLYREDFSPEQQAILADFLSRCCQGIKNHRVSVSYTNIWLMKTWNLIALGEGLDDQATADDGYKMLEEWINYTARTGINEYLSPSYYSVDLESLGLIYNLSNNSKAVRLAGRGIEYFWNEIALNWYAPAERLGGTHSRNYDRLLHRGDLVRTLTEAGLIGETTFRAENPYAFYTHTTAPRLNFALPRYVSGRCGELAEQRWHLFMEKDYTIGSSETAYVGGPDDTPLVINLGENRDVLPINFFMDSRRDHYGQNKTIQKNGHMKALHLRPNIISVQNDNEVLFAAAANAKNNDSVSLESNIILPAQAEYFSNNMPLAIDNHVSSWQYNPAPNGKSTKIGTKDFEGQTVLNIVDSDNKLGVGVARNFPANPGETYRLSAEINSDRGIYLYLNFLSANGKLVDHERIFKASSKGRTSFTAVAPEGTAYCKAWLYSTSSAVTNVQVTDLCFEQLTPQPKIMGEFDFYNNRPVEIEMPTNGVLFIKQGSTVAALRLLGAWNSSENPISFKLYNDGLFYGALRLTAMHSRIKTEAYGAVAVWAKVVGNIKTADDFADFREQVLASSAIATYREQILEAQNGAMHIRYNTVSGKRLLREGMKEIPPKATLWFNGRDLAPYLLLGVER